MSTRPLTSGKVRHHIDRIYRTQATAYIWARELVANAGEAGAERIWFGIEPQSAAAGSFRRVVVDDGWGMDADQLVTFFSGWGVGSKDIGGDHDNMGIGAKTMTLPWNRAGVIVVSKTSDMTEAAVVWLHYDAELDDYGLKEFEVHDEDGDVRLEPVVTAYHDRELGIDLARLLPDWAGEHGTAVLLLGDSLDGHTVLGATSEGETSATGLGRYLNSRFDTPPYEMDITVEHVVGDGPDAWTDTYAAGAVKRRTIHGCRHFTHGTRAGDPDPVEGVVELSDGTKVEWSLRPDATPASFSSLSPVKRGTIQFGYDRKDDSGRELFARTTHQSTYRSAGISNPEVAKRLYLTFVPPRAGEGPNGSGALMETARASLRWIAEDGSRGELPMASWSSEFAMRMPGPVIDALDAARGTGEVTISREDVERLAALFRNRWRVELPRPAENGDDVCGDSGPAATDTPGEEHDGAGGNGTSRNGRGAGAGGDGPRPARRAPSRGGVPRGEGAREADFGADAHHLACFTAPSAAEPAGLVQVNIDHPVIRGEVGHWSELYPAHLHSEIESIVHSVYITSAVTTVAHIEGLRGRLKLTSSTTESWRGPDALTSGLLGLWGLEARITRALNGLGVKRVG